ncbi:MAG: DUF2798 domain-containing protein [Pseudomonadota bacterium]
MIPSRYYGYAFPLCLAGIMSFLMSGVGTTRNIGFVDGFVGMWLQAWPISWAIAFPIALMVEPIARRRANLLCEPPANTSQRTEKDV